MLPINTADILFDMGFTVDDFVVLHTKDNIELQWLSTTKKRPLDEQILARTDTAKLKTAKQRKLAALSIKTNQTILDKYPMHYQMNVTNGIRGTDADKEQMVSDINDILASHDATQLKIKKVVSQKELDAIEI